MNPSVGDFFWSHMPGFAWPILVAGVLGLSLYEAFRAIVFFAKFLGPAGKKIHNSFAPRRIDKRLARMEEILVRATDRLECAMAYLTADAMYHQDADIIIAENAPNVIPLLPERIPFTEFARRWKNGDRPAFYED